MTQPAEAALAHQRVYAGPFGTLQDVIVWNMVLPADVEDALEAPHIEGVEPKLLLYVGGPGFTSME